MTAMPSPVTSKSQPVDAEASERFKIVVIGGGTAGITVAARLARAGELDVAIIEPSDKHYYQPAFTLVGGGIMQAEDTVRDEQDYLPKNATWLKDFAEAIDPRRNRVLLRSGKVVGYDYLVVAPGIQLDWDAIPGLREALKTDFVSSNYDFALAPKTWQMLKGLERGRALFTQPSGVIKCGGAPQKIAYLAADYFQRERPAGAVEVVFATPGERIFGVAEFRTVLEGVVERYGIEARFGHELVEIRPDVKEAVFDIVLSASIPGEPCIAGERLEQNGARVILPYDVMHVVPPQSAPDFVKKSPLADAEGWLEVDKHTLQSPSFANVFALGDAASLPTARTGAAVRKQAPVLVENMLAVMAGNEPRAHYDGYASCPLLTAHNRVLLAEFDYDGKPAPSLPINTQKERYDMYLLKRYGLPLLYWNFMLRGRA